MPSVGDAVVIGSILFGLEVIRRIALYAREKG
jgi:hypothetical protein